MLTSHQGYSLAYSRTAGPFIGDLANFGMKNVAAAPSIGGSNIPEIVFCLYQLMFCACTVQLVIGGSFERGRIVPSLIFAFFWATVVYCPIACWTWNPNGWLFKLPSLDFAGGGPVHISSGWSALAYAFALGKRKHTGEKSHGRPHNTTLIFLGTVLIWFGWFGFNVSFLPFRCSYRRANTNKLLLTYNRVVLQSTAQSEP
jgi:ammonium transporter, Amt family